MTHRGLLLLSAVACLFALGGCHTDPEGIVLSDMTDTRNQALPTATVTQYAGGDSETVEREFTCGPYRDGARISFCEISIPRGSSPTRFVVDAPGFLPFDEVLESEAGVEQADSIVLQDDPAPVELCEAYCAKDLECQPDSAPPPDVCLEFCLEGFELTGSPSGDKCRPHFAAVYDCTSQLDCDGFLDFFNGGDTHECVLFVEGVDQCDGADGGLPPSDG